MTKNCCLNPKMKIHGNVVVGPKGQIVIPKEVRDLLGIETGDTLVVTTKHDLAIGIIKGSDVMKFMDYVKKELDELTSSANISQ